MHKNQSNLAPKKYETLWNNDEKIPILPWFAVFFAATEPAMPR